MSLGIFKTPTPINEPVRNYAPQDADTLRLKAALQKMAAETVEIPLVIDGQQIRTEQTVDVVMPHAHREKLAVAHLATERELQLAVQSCQSRKANWENLAWNERAAVFLKAADLLAGPWRDRINAATMLGQSKNAYQAEIDAACEFIDFLRFNVHFYQQMLEMQPISGVGIWNRVEYRALEGFVLAITPFNFTAIAANLPILPALLGNTVIWKPSDTQLRAAWETLQLLEAAGLPSGVIQFVPCEPKLFGQTLLTHRDLAGVHFTGSTATFQHLWKTVGENIANYRTYPRLVGETGGKDFVFAHASADVDALCVALIRGAFEYQGQKCSAASRAYIPQSVWKRLKPQLLDTIRTLKMGDTRDFSCFVNAVIDARAFDRIQKVQAFCKSSADAEILIGGASNGDVGYFIEPTVVEAKRPDFRTMSEEIFGPLLTLFVYDDSKFEETLTICDQTSPYALTGAIFAQDRGVLAHMSERLKHAAGNFYINDKPTGAVVGQQPFGGARASGTNDKAGSLQCVLRWTSPRTLKETLVPARDYRYPFML